MKSSPYADAASLTPPLLAVGVLVVEVVKVAAAAVVAVAAEEVAITLVAEA